MNYRLDMEHCLKYIEKHILDYITAQDIANEIGYSLYHFCRVFSSYVGISLMEYIRKRRLTLAALELSPNKKIIDIALQYGFETPSGFSKPFRKEFGYSPMQYIKNLQQIQPLNEITKGVIPMNPTIITKPAFHIAGYGIHTNIASSKYTKDIAAFWDNYEGENLESKLYDILKPPKHGEVALCVPSTDNGNVTYLLGVIVDDFSKTTSDMITVTVPEATYAVFTTSPLDTVNDCEQREFAQVIKATWKWIFEEWFSNSNYIYDEDKLDFEYYDERCHFQKDTVMDIYIPIKPKE